MPFLFSIVLENSQGSRGLWQQQKQAVKEESRGSGVWRHQSSPGAGGKNGSSGSEAGSISELPTAEGLWGEACVSGELVLPSQAHPQSWQRRATLSNPRWFSLVTRGEGKWFPPGTSLAMESNPYQGRIGACGQPWGWSDIDDITGIPSNPREPLLPGGSLENTSW